jgi:hypothetical protein
MTHDNYNLKLETGRSRSHPPDRQRATVALVNRELTLADTAEILEIALRRNAARWQMKFGQRMSRPSASVIANGQHGALVFPLRGHEPRPETSGSGHSLLVWHTVL